MTANEGPHIEYPCSWSYRLIGGPEDAIRDAVRGVVGDEPYELTVSNTSESGRHISLKLSLEVRDEAGRLAIQQRLQECEAIRMVL